MKNSFNESRSLIDCLDKLTCKHLTSEKLVKIISLKRECENQMDIYNGSINSIGKDFGIESDNGFIIAPTDPNRNEIINRVNLLGQQETEIPFDSFLTMDELTLSAANLTISELDLCARKIVIQKPADK